MPSVRPRITDMLSRIGLRAPCTQKKEDRKTSPYVEEFWFTEVPHLCDLYYMKTNLEIQASHQIRCDAFTLADKFGPAIWCATADQRNRSWLYKPGEGFGSVKYERDLYYDDANDREILKQAIHDLVTEKILMCHKRKYQKPTRAATPSDRSFSEDLQRRRSKRNSTNTTRDITLNCFACPTLSATVLDAAWIRDHGIWLGDDLVDSASINGRSFDEVRQNYFEATLGGLEKGYQEPAVFDRIDEDSELVQCAACHEFGNGQTGTMEIRTFHFGWKESKQEQQTTLDMFVWGLQGTLNGKAVFALLRKEPKARASDPQYWSFWQIDGGYTKSILLVSTPAPKGPGPVKQEVGISPEGRDALPIREASISSLGGRATKRRRLDTHRESTRSGKLPQNGGTADNEVHSDWEMVDAPPTSTSWRPINHHLDTAKGVQSRVPVADEDNDFDSMYDVTPGPGNRHVRSDALPRDLLQEDNDGAATITEDAFANATTPEPPQPQIKAPPSRQSQPQGSALQSAPPTSVGTHEESLARTLSSTPAPTPIRVWLTATWASNRYVVPVDHEMNVQAVYTTVQDRLQRKLDGRAIEAIEFRFQAPSSDEKPLEVGAGEEFAWQAVLQLCKDKDANELYATVLRAE